MKETLIYESKKSKIFFCEDTEWGKPVVMKVSNYEFATPKDLSQFYNEYEVIKQIKLGCIRNVLKRGRENNRHYLMLEWIEGENLSVAFRGKQNDIIDFLYLAIAMAEALSQIHNSNVIHKDISPFNVIVNLQERSVHIIDFGISTSLDLKQQYLGNPERLEGTLAYSSPEQTGRMNRLVDYRTDLYSLGVTLYEMLTGKLPFDSTDAMELVHSHIALVPRPVEQINAIIPTQISKIVDKLLAKNAEDRYQSAHGLKTDLEKCLNEFSATGSISSFPLAVNDFSGKFLLPEKLYGREAEIETIIKAFDRCATGALEILLVAGYSGTGKTALVHEVFKPITAKNGYFISGKFDQFQRVIPYYAIIEAFKELVNIFLTENEEKLTTLREEIQNALGNEGKVLTNVIPNLEHIIGVQPDIPELAGAESQNRFNYVFRKFVKAICTKEHPLVLFIDDLQWADSASLNLLEILLTDSGVGCLLCIGAYRTNEVSVSHPVMNAVSQIKEAGTTIELISVENLSLENLTQLLYDAFNGSRETILALAELVYEKTRGNAFFVRQFLKLIYEEKLLQFDFRTSNWHWNIDKIREKNITDNVVDLMAAKIQRLPGDTQELMKIGSCIGNSCSYQVLSMVLQKSDENLVSELHAALKEGLIVPLGDDKMKFSHDRIQQAVYSLIPADEKVSVHLSIGKLLLAHTPVEERDENIFGIVNQLNFGRDLIRDLSEREHLCRLNLQAGRKAKQNSAFQPSFEYFQTGIELLQQNAWAQHYSLSLSLYQEACEAAYLTGQFDKMESLFEVILANATSTLEKVKAYEIRILGLKAQNKLHEAISTGLEILKLLGERFPKNPGKVQILSELVYTMARLRGKNNDYLMNLPIMTNETKIAAMRIIADITSSIYWGMPNLLPLIVFRMIRISLSYGNTAVSCFAYGSFGVINCGLLGFMKKGNEYGKLALSLIDKLNAKEWKAQIYVTPYALTFHWRNHVRTTLQPLQESYQIGMETGLIEFACVNTNIYCIHAFLCGKPLAQTEEETADYSRNYKLLNQLTNFNYNEVYRQAMHNFMGRNSNPLILTGEAFQEEQMLQQNQERDDKTGTFFIYFLKCMLAYYFEEPRAAQDNALKAGKLLDAVLAKFEIPNLAFYHALSLIGQVNTNGTGESNLIAKAKKYHQKLKTWAKDAPMNFGHKADLIQAELLRVTGKISEARSWYDKAIEGASKNEYIHEEALACELAGKFYISQNSNNLAEYYLKAAYSSYREWGAIAKLRHLSARYPNFLSGMDQQDSAMTSGTNVDARTSMVHGSLLDISTLVKASTTISGEVVLSKLLTVLMRIVIENAGAQRGLLCLERDGILYIEGKIEEGASEAEVLNHVAVENSDQLPQSIVKFVERTYKHMVIEDAVADPRYKNDPYVIGRHTRSVLCLPVIKQGNLMGILYLENNLATGVFTQERVNLLSLLSGQIAVSIDNAVLYNNLEQKVNERTNDLMNEKKKSDSLLYNILPVETAQELKRNGFAAARQFEKVTILFTDFKGFTSISEKLSPQDLVREIDKCFRAFDTITSKYNIEKIKTIGDSYMAAGGLPIPNSTHAEDVVKAALEIRDYMKSYRTESGIPIEVRVGINTGSVVAGIVGTKKFQYDIWGDAVNTASRMESAGEPGKVNISENTFNLVKNKFDCFYRGEISAKGKGSIKMYFVGYKNASPETTKPQ